MNIEDLTIKQAREIASLFGGTNQPHITSEKPRHPYIGRIVIVRTYASGVHFAALKEFDAKNNAAILSGSVRIWSWQGAFTLSEVANNGIKSGKLSESINEMFVTQVIELIPCAQKAIDSLNAIKPYNA